MLVQRQQKTFGSRLAVEVAVNATLGRRTGIHGVVQAGAVRLKDIKVMDNGSSVRLESCIGRIAL